MEKGISKKGNNIELEVTGSKMILTIDLKKNLGVSKSGKSLLIASTKGNQVLDDGLTVGINIFKPVSNGDDD